MPFSFPKTSQFAGLVGRFPCAAADALVGSLGWDEAHFVTAERVQGYPRRPGGLPHDCVRTVLGNLNDIGRKRVPHRINLVIAAASTTTAAASAVSTFAPASAATPATGSSVAASAATPGPAAPAFPHRARHIHYQRKAQKILAIAGLNGSLGFFVVAEFREPETTRFTGKFVADNLNGIGLKSIPSEPVL